MSNDKTLDTSFTINGEKYSSLMDFLGGAGDSDMRFLEALSQHREDELRDAIAAYTEQMQENQAKVDVDFTERCLKALAAFINAVGNPPHLSMYFAAARAILEEGRAKGLL